MSTITVAKNDAGQLRGLTAEDERGWKKFWDMVASLGAGEFFSLEIWFPRDPTLHKRHFAVIGAIFDAQDRFLKIEALRAWLYVGAGHCELFPGLDGKTVAIPKSVKYSEIDDEDFRKVHAAMMEFLAGEYCRGVLWPRMAEESSAELLELLLRPQLERQP